MNYDFRQLTLEEVFNGINELVSSKKYLRGEGKKKNLYKESDKNRWFFASFIICERRSKEQ